MAWYFIVLLTIVAYNLIGVVVVSISSITKESFEESIGFESVFTRFYTYGIFALIIMAGNYLLKFKKSKEKNNG